MKAFLASSGGVALVIACRSQASPEGAAVAVAAGWTRRAHHGIDSKVCVRRAGCRESNADEERKASSLLEKTAGTGRSRLSSATT